MKIFVEFEITVDEEFLLEWANNQNSKILRKNRKNEELERVGIIRKFIYFVNAFYSRIKFGINTLLCLMSSSFQGMILKL